MQKVTKSSVMEELMEKMSLPGQRALKDGQITEGKVISIMQNTLYVDLGGAKTGIVSSREYRNAISMIKDLKPGDTVQATVVELENDEGYVELSMKEASRERSWINLRGKMDGGEVISIRVKEANKGGLMAEHEGIAGFMPVSQLSYAHYPRVEGGDKQKIFQELQKFVGQDLKVRIIGVDQQENKLIFSEKAAEDKELKDLLSNYQIGMTVEGTVSGVVNFGAFVKFDENLEGLVHISELDWQLIENPSDIVNVGDKVKAEIIGIEEDRVSLSIKRLKPNPWDTVGERFTAGDVVKARVMKLNPFGAFAKLDRDIHGLAHISEFGTEENMKEKLKIGEEYEFTILSIEPRDYKMALGFGKQKPKKDTEEKTVEKTETPQDAADTKTEPDPA
ncbi:MAG: S1 RNA-binding domain-containing protein [bacterium]|nr:S1 RNA-binding domain-containing protein [bacterium]